MEIIESIKNEFIGIAKAFKESPGACLFLECVFAVCSLLCLRFIVSALLKMHRSGTKAKKLYNNYGFCQRVIMKPAWQECLHAKGFCKALIVIHHTRTILLLLTSILVIASGIFPEFLAFSASFSAAQALCIDLPILVLHWALDRYPFQKRKHEYRFEKYHNTKDYQSLF